ncbi:hypothetical protein FJU08_17470 [Martelella alba]|uniref:Uncharacterized protein n=1 Tax=Martelella alba TaxID=2590451 RepID=A0A506U2K3_9HYPH|nr:hypothetical protein [Martelella alba]TPW28593.1 hypothetical protein FJU08_17470 [Martelella alba]
MALTNDRPEELLTGKFVQLETEWEDCVFGEFDCRLSDLLRAPEPLRSEGIALINQRHEELLEQGR